MVVVADRYAKALVEALSPDAAEEGLEQLRRLAALVESEPEAAKLLMSPTVPVAARARFLDEIGQAFVPDRRVRRLFELIVERRRLEWLGDIIRSYQKMLDARSGVVRAVVTTAAPLAAAEQEEVLARLESAMGKRVVMDLRRDASLISGVVVQIGSTVYDGSLRQHLAGFKKRLLAG